ncbi:hypothetical protein CNR22_02230 [Sphingobacteriaceae bacterium]|nr:hypothetical protein CNR22_02230 [Sphingobacteriaceae bacterium]
MKFLSLKIAFLAGVLSIAYYMLINYVYFSDFGFVESGRIVFASPYGYFDYLLLPFCIVTGQAIYRKRNNANLTYHKLIAFGWKTSLLASIIFATFIYTALQLSSPNYFEDLITLIKEMNASGNEPEPFTQKLLIHIKPLEATPLFRSALFYAIANLFAYFFLGTLSSWIFAILIKNTAMKK